MLSFAMWRRGGSAAMAWLIALLFGVAGSAGCGTMQFETGRKFNPDVLEHLLRTGVSTQADVRRVLGEPFGTGRALMPYQESDRTVWTYYYERGSIDLGSGNTKDQRLYLFLFLAGDQFDGYMWFASQLN